KLPARRDQASSASSSPTEQHLNGAPLDRLRHRSQSDLQGADLTAGQAARFQESGERRRRPAMGRLGKLVDGIKEKLGGRKTKAACSSDYGKLDKTGSMRVEIRSRLAQKLIAKNLAVADSITGNSPRAAAAAGGGGRKKKKKRFFAF
ncbi:hypothetical protein EJB05_42886, partial [Eragrostis curvula]